jgi:putative redox protein
VTKPPTVVDLVWTSRLEFSARTERAEMILDSAGAAGPSPVDALCAALAGCMAMDLAHILSKGRHGFTAMAARLVAQRAQDHPHRILSATLHFAIAGNVPVAAVERAIALSHEKYCSVWHSLRQDILLQVTFAVAP